MEKTNFSLNPRYKRILRYLILSSILTAAYFTFQAVFTDIYSPGSMIAREYADYAMWVMGLTVVLALPLFFIRAQSIKNWADEMQSIEDQSLRNKLLWGFIRPVLMQGIYIGFMAVISYIIISTYFQIPQDIILNYTNYYNPQKLNMTDMEFINTTIKQEFINITMEP